MIGFYIQGEREKGWWKALSSHESEAEARGKFDEIVSENPNYLAWRIQRVETTSSVILELAGGEK